MKRHPLLLLLVLLVLMDSVQAQSQGMDALNDARVLNSKGRFGKAEQLLADYCGTNTNDVNGWWLYGQTAYLAGHFKKSDAAYRKAIALNPGNGYLQLDYGIKLAEMGQFDKAAGILNKYLAYDSTATSAYQALAKISFWQVAYKKALHYTNRGLKFGPADRGLLELRNEILQAQSPWLKIGASVTADDQPLQKITPQTEAGVSLNPLANLHAGIYAPLFLRDGELFNAQQLEIGNKMIFTKAGVEVNVAAGLVRLPNAKISGIANFQLSKNFTRHLVLAAQVQHQPYLFNRANTTNPIMQLHYGFALGWNDVNNWQGKASVDVNHFYTDKNLLYTASAWVLSQPLKVSVLEFRFGYAYNFSTTKESRYTSIKTVNEIVANWDSAAAIPGTYAPYFTPYKQQMHSVIVAVNIHPLKTMDIGLKANVGIYATTQNPYLYLNTTAANEVVIERGFAKQQFYPAGASAYIAAQVAPKIGLKAEYTFMKTNFYTSHYAALGLKISFWK